MVGGEDTGTDQDFETFHDRILRELWPVCHPALGSPHQTAVDPPAKASRSTGAYIEVRGFESDAIDVAITALRRGEALDESGPAVGPALVVTRDDAVLDVVTLDAHALAFAWIDAQTMVVLDAGGHVSFWRRGSARGPRSRM